MRLDFGGERVLAVVAHPDDAELLCAGTLARALADGAAVGVCVLCRGDRGQPTPPLPDLAAVRRREMKAAAALLGAELFAGGFGDSTLADERPARNKLIEIYRRFRPTLVLAHAPDDYHPDHQAAAAVAEAASWFAASPGQSTRSAPLDQPPALWCMDCVNATPFQPGFYIDITPHVELKHRMLACHKSQLQRSGDRDFAPLADLMQRQMTTRGAEAGVTAAEAFRIHRALKRTRAW